jgi:hypothetical protein
MPVLLGLFTALFCVYYLVNSHDKLQTDYLAVAHCMYREPLWKEGFFNQQVKDAGNVYASIGLVLALLVVGWGWILRKRIIGPVSPLLSFIRGHILQLSLLIGAVIVLWFWGMLASVPAYDEVFSAVNCAGVHPLQTVAYYMLPNNHILFNLINNLVFHPVYDKVFTGRILSGISQLALSWLIYWWLYQKLNNKWYALIYTTLLLLQFPVWGFSFQARGYALYLLSAFASAIGLEQYFRTRSNGWLLVHSLAICLGFAVMPSFLFWYFGLIIIAFGYSVWSRRLDFGFFKAHIISGICVYCFYLPGLCYSGLSAFTDNQYVRALDIPWKDYWSQIGKDLDSTAQYTFAGNVDGHSTLYAILFYVPFLAALLLFKSRARNVLLINLSVWLAFLLLQLKFRHYPFMRNMTAHVCIGLCALLMALHFTTLWISTKVRVKLLLPVVVAAFCLAAGVHFVRFMNGHIHDSLYYYDAKTGYDLPMQAIAKIPKTSRVWCSDQSFYLQYLLKRRGSDASHCMDEGQEYFITDRNEGVPPTSLAIQPVDSVLQYLIYKRQ